jgi:hypothetical protein
MVSHPNLVFLGFTKTSSSDKNHPPSAEEKSAVGWGDPVFSTGLSQPRECSFERGRWSFARNPTALENYFPVQQLCTIRE